MTLRRNKTYLIIRRKKYFACLISSLVVVEENFFTAKIPQLTVVQKSVTKVFIKKYGSTSYLRIAQVLKRPPIYTFIQLQAGVKYSATLLITVHGCIPKWLLVITR